MVDFFTRTCYDIAVKCKKGPWPLFCSRPGTDVLCSPAGSRGKYTLYRRIIMKHKLLSILLCLAMALSLLPTAALADEGEAARTGDLTYTTANETISGFTYTSGKMTINAENVTVENVTFGDGARLEVKASGNFTLKNCTFNGKTDVRTPVTLNVGSATVTGNTFNGTKTDGTPTYYNAIEFAVNSGNKLSSATLSNNIFEAAIKNNYFSTYYYADNAVITAENNVIKLANRGSNAIRISNVTNSNVTFNLNNNSYEFSDASGSSEYEGFIILQDFTKKSGNTEDFSKVTINISNLTSPSDASRLFYVWEDSVGLVSDNNPVIKGDSSIEKFFTAKVGDTYYKTLADAVAAVQNGDTITLLKDVDLGNTVTVANKTVTLNMAGKTIYNTKDLWDSKLNAWSLISVRENGNLTITGDGTLKAKADDCYALDTQEGSAKLTVENGTVIGNISAIYAFLGEVTINGGSYSIQQLNTNNVQDGYGLTINCYDQNYKEKTAKITVTGGYFAHFDPANNKAEGVGTNFVKDGYVSVTSDKSGYDYKVVKKTDTGSIVVKPAVAEPEVKVSDKISKNDKAAVENAAKSVAVPTLGAAATAQAQQIDAEKAAALIAKVTEVNKDNAKLYVQVSLKVAPTAYTDTTGNKELALEITPQYRIVASTADKADNIELSDNSKNAQVVQDYQKLTITAPTVVTMELPTGFANANDKLSIKHIKDNGTVEYYTGIVTETSGTKTLTFTTNGFSPFVISSAVASIDGVMYPTLAEAVANVDSGKTIKLETDCAEAVTVSRTVKFTLDKNNHAFTGSIKAGSYTTVTATDTEPVEYTFTYSRPSSGSSSYDPTYSVSTPSKTEHGTVTVSPKSASKGDRVTVTVKPDSGYVLETLTVTDKNGNELTLKDKGNGKYTFTMPAGKVEVKATFMEDNSMLNFFYDVPNNAYFYEAVKWAVENGITTGVGNNLFAPEQPCTRAQIVTFLWRAAGSPEPKGAASGMTDVVSGSYYEKAVAWAIENGITTGTTTSTFSPDATCTRAQAVTFLARALKAKAASAAEFSDVPTGSYFADAVAWAAANGVTEGIGGGLFGSDNDCTRGQIVTFLYRAYNK